MPKTKMRGRYWLLARRDSEGDESRYVFCPEPSRYPILAEGVAIAASWEGRYAWALDAAADAIDERGYEADRLTLLPSIYADPTLTRRVR